MIESFLWDVISNPQTRTWPDFKSEQFVPVLCFTSYWSKLLRLEIWSSPRFHLVLEQTTQTWNLVQSSVSPRTGTNYSDLKFGPVRVWGFAILLQVVCIFHLWLSIHRIAFLSYLFNYTGLLFNFIYILSLYLCKCKIIHAGAHRGTACTQHAGYIIV